VRAGDGRLKFMNILRPHQQKTVNECPNKWALWFKMRVGKTPTAITLADNRCQSALVIVPKYLATQWKNEIAKWSNGRCKFTVITKETFRRDWSKLPKYEAIIADEVHLGFGNYKSLLFKALYSYIKTWDTQYIWLLTGTPLTSNEWSTYSYGKLLGREWKWYQWDQLFFDHIPMGRRKVPVFKKKMGPTLQKYLQSLGIIIDLKDIADVADDYEEIQTVEMTSEIKKEIDNIVDVIPITLYTKRHMCESGVLKGDNYVEDKSFYSSKDDRVLSLCEENDRIVIVVRYLALIDKYKEMLSALTDRNIYEISGRIKEGAGEVAKKADADSGKVIILLQSDTVAGYSLKSFDTMVFASMSYSFVNYDQCRSRIKAMEKQGVCSYIHLITEGKSVDKAVYDCIKRREDFSAELFNKK
jgi:hypothetical protein